MTRTTNPHLNPLPQPEGKEDAKRQVRVFRLLVVLSLAVSSQLLSCETANYVPHVTTEMATKGERQRGDVAKLERGRTLFVHRCIECHTLPAIWRYTTKDWTGIVNDMSHRASLKPAERDAIIAYILAVREEM